MPKLNLIEFEGETALVFPQEMLDRLRVREGDTLYVIEREGRVVLSPINLDPPQTSENSDNSNPAH
jgi:bifunctional DNA-binding transcriptional regulator/antitoxin component of YhaV-PrlF toxin-antitoxin module